MQIIKRWLVHWLLGEHLVSKLDSITNELGVLRNKVAILEDIQRGLNRTPNNNTGSTTTL